MGVDEKSVLDEAIEGIIKARPPVGELAPLEEAITAVENDRMEIPGTPVVVDASSELPAEEAHKGT